MPSMYYRDPAIDALSDAAEVMFLHGASMAGEINSDGFIPDALVHHLTRHWRRAAKLAAELADAGLWARADGGYCIVGFDRFALPESRQHIPREIRLAVYARDGYACVFCGATEPLSLDHIWPWSLGGSDEPENLQTLCIPCNSKKGARV